MELILKINLSTFFFFFLKSPKLVLGLTQDSVSLAAVSDFLPGRTYIEILYFPLSENVCFKNTLILYPQRAQPSVAALLNTEFFKGGRKCEIGFCFSRKSRYGTRKRRKDEKKVLLTNGSLASLK